MTDHHSRALRLNEVLDKSYLLKEYYYNVGLYFRDFTSEPLEKYIMTSRELLQHNYSNYHNFYAVVQAALESINEISKTFPITKYKLEIINKLSISIMRNMKELVLTKTDINTLNLLDKLTTLVPTPLLEKYDLKVHPNFGRLKELEVNYINHEMNFEELILFIENHYKLPTEFSVYNDKDLFSKKVRDLIDEIYIEEVLNHTYGAPHGA